VRWNGVRYDRVVLVGHSLGSLISWYEAAQFHDVDAVISSGILHTFDGPSVARFGLTLYPAASIRASRAGHRSGIPHHAAG